MHKIEHRIDHYIQRYIMGVLSGRAKARFRDMRPPQTDTNLYAYHLKVLVKRGFTESLDDGYRLSTTGLAYADTLSQVNHTTREQPKIITMMVIQDGYGQLLLQKRTKQPYIDTWTLVYGKLHLDDSSVVASAHRELQEKSGLTGVTLRHAGDAYLRVTCIGEPLSTTLAHIFHGEIDEPVEDERFTWCDPAKLGKLNLAPCVEAIVARTFFRDPFFFEEFHEDWRR